MKEIKVQYQNTMVGEIYKQYLIYKEYLKYYNSDTEEKLKFQLIGAQLRVDIWRTNQANNRFIEKATV